jgi:hypothetical protein
MFPVRLKKSSTLWRHHPLIEIVALEIRIQFSQIKINLSRPMRGIHQNKRADGMRSGDHAFDRHHQSGCASDLVQHCQPGTRAKTLCEDSQDCLIILRGKGQYHLD